SSAKRARRDIQPASLAKAKPELQPAIGNSGGARAGLCDAAERRCVSRGGIRAYNETRCVLVRGVKARKVKFYRPERAVIGSSRSTQRCRVRHLCVGLDHGVGHFVEMTFQKGCSQGASSPSLAMTFTHNPLTLLSAK